MGLGEPICLTSSRNVGGMGVGEELMNDHATTTPSPMRRQLTRQDGFLLDDTPMGELSVFGCWGGVSIYDICLWWW